jgi:hypothetical protein
MELIIPLIGLGGLFAIKRRKEGFGNKLNTEIPKNYPTEEKHQNLLNDYSDPNTATDKYFNQTLYRDQSVALPNNRGNTIQQVYSLTGKYVEANDFTHDNMVPFYRSKMGTGTGVKNNETILDNMVGTYNNMIKKTEQSPLFKPEIDVNWVNGMPNMDEFYLSRTQAGMTMNNVKPFESVMVAPGLNKGYDNSGSGGYNSGMESRESWMDKNVDELRVSTNPKTTYTLDNLEGPVKSLVSNIGIQAPVNKNLPDSFYALGPERYFTTPTEAKGQMMHSEEMIKEQNRAGTSTEYSGPPTSIVKQNGYVTKNYHDPKRQELPTSDVRVCSAVGKGGYEGFDTMHKSHTNYINNRSVNANTPLLNVSSTIGSILAPITDLLKPNKRDEMSKNPRMYGNGKSGVNSSYIANQYVAPTIKETTLYTPNSFQGHQNGVGGYITHDTRTINNQRDDTTYTSFGNIGGTTNNLGAKDYSADYRQTNNELKEATTYTRTNHGNTQMFNPQMNVNIAKQEQDRINNRQWVPSSMPQTFAAKEMMGQTYKPLDEMTKVDNRLDGDLLLAFKSNPYTQSLQSF